MHLANQIRAAIGVTPFVVVPAEHAAVAITVGAGHQGVNNRRVRIADDVARYQRNFGILHDAIEGTCRRIANHLIDEVAMRLGAEFNDEIHQ